MNGERIAALEGLVLLNYPFGHEPGYIPRIINTEGYPGTGLEFEYWVEQFDWLHLQRLKTPDVEFALKLAPKLTALQVFSHNVNVYYHKDDNTSFYTCIPARLASISVPTLEDITLKGILRHANFAARAEHSSSRSRPWLA